jgi:hypothetical protein
MDYVPASLGTMMTSWMLFAYSVTFPVLYVMSVAHSMIAQCVIQILIIGPCRRSGPVNCVYVKMGTSSSKSPYVASVFQYARHVQSLRLNV